ncbi:MULTISPECIES: hypothetical protein [Bacillaceae]|uniref:hypothetical protein n=1 Tax=Bacillaceae TaxID=186817 RepID=UPI000BFCE2D4|nr:MULTISPECIES: hypothetical protein [Bacillaceae]PGT80786.1 hypothetical protein COD11_19865 [Bacillus sp. AFS040349]UGB30746.1 hypothetical protein LPC09_24120 [Metabacillus sp. B2-18]
MFTLLFILALTGFSLVLCLRKRKPQFLLIPVLTLLLYFIVQIALVPASFIDTIKFIFSLS